MGFDRNRVLEAFLLCDRNEEMAANFLFDSMNDEVSSQTAVSFTTLAN